MSHKATEHTGVVVVGYVVDVDVTVLNLAAIEFGNKAAGIVGRAGCQEGDDEELVVDKAVDQSAGVGGGDGTYFGAAQFAVGPAVVDGAVVVAHDAAYIVAVDDGRDAQVAVLDFTRSGIGEDDATPVGGTGGVVHIVVAVFYLAGIVVAHAANFLRTADLHGRCSDTAADFSQGHVRVADAAHPAVVGEEASEGADGTNDFGIWMVGVTDAAKADTTEVKGSAATGGCVDVAVAYDTVVVFAEGRIVVDAGATDSGIAFDCQALHNTIGGNGGKNGLQGAVGDAVADVRGGGVVGHVAGKVLNTGSPIVAGQDNVRTHDAEIGVAGHFLAVEVYFAVVTRMGETVADILQLGNGINLEGTALGAVADKSNRGLCAGSELLDTDGAGVGDTIAAGGYGECLGEVVVVAALGGVHGDGEAIVRGGIHAREGRQHQIEAAKSVAFELKTSIRHGEGQAIATRKGGQMRVEGTVINHVEHAGQLLVATDTDGSDGEGLTRAVVELQSHNAGQVVEVEVGGRVHPAVAIPGHHRQHLFGKGGVVAVGLLGRKADLYRGEKVTILASRDNAVVGGEGMQSHEVHRAVQQVVGGENGIVFLKVSDTVTRKSGLGGRFTTCGRHVAADADFIASLPVNPLFVDKLHFAVAGGLLHRGGEVHFHGLGELFLARDCQQRHE